jgi:hypothetical protein
MPSTSLSLGLEDGLRYAGANPLDRRLLGRIVRAHTAAEVASFVAGTIVPPDAAADAAAYWSGFAHGVRRFLQENLEA